MRAVVLAFSGLFGLAIGSFLTVVGYRIPRRESIVRPGSHCPSCNRALAWYDNIPVASWILLRRRCRSCSAAISVRYPALEMATAFVFVGLAAAIGPRPRLLVALVVASLVLAAGAVALGGRSRQSSLPPGCER